MSVTWTSGYNIGEAVPFVEWSGKGIPSRRSPAGTLTFTRNSMCGMRLWNNGSLHSSGCWIWNLTTQLNAGAPARTVGWRDPGFFHTAFLKHLWPNLKYMHCLEIEFPFLSNHIVWITVLKLFGFFITSGTLTGWAMSWRMDRLFGARITPLSPLLILGKTRYNGS